MRRKSENFPDVWEISKDIFTDKQILGQPQKWLTCKLAKQAYKT